VVDIVYNAAINATALFVDMPYLFNPCTAPALSNKFSGLSALIYPQIIG
jgi:hypothetical protein